ncbi:MAG: ATP-binding cassette domain-containing protein, partial [Propionibacteriaceae bacterium]|nr:ATP-binding cassette domain-containing protein [Propionibacteriaceae bacterium]
QALGWDSVPGSVRDARRRVLREAITVEAPSDPPLASGTPRVQVTDLTVTYGTTTAVAGVSLDLHGGEVTCLMGRNGAGKSSLLWAVQGGTASTGTVTVDGLDPRTLKAPRARSLVSLVPQTASDLLYLPTVAAELAQADQETGSSPGTAAAVLARLGSDLDPDADPRDLSEGQRLSLVLALQLAAEPGVVLLDEPTRGLDYAMKEHLAAILADLAAGGRAVVVSTHDVEFAAAVSARTIVMAEGEVIADGPTRAVVTSSPTFAPQTAKVFAPVPVLVPGEVGGAA